VNARPEELRTNLRAIDQHRAQLQTTLIGALNRRLIDDLQTRSPRDRAIRTGLTVC